MSSSDYISLMDSIERLRGRKITIDVSYKSRKPDPFKWHPMKKERRKGK